MCRGQRIFDMKSARRGNCDRVNVGIEQSLQRRCRGTGVLCGKCRCTVGTGAVNACQFRIFQGLERVRVDCGGCSGTEFHWIVSLVIR